MSISTATSLGQVPYQCSHIKSVGTSFLVPLHKYKLPRSQHGQAYASSTSYIDTDNSHE